MTISTEAANLTITSPYIELFILNLGRVGSNTVYYLTPNAGTVIWKGHTYTPWPIALAGMTTNGDGTQSKPQVSVSIVTPGILTAVQSLGDLVGASLIRYRTFAKFLDNGSNPDPTAFFPSETYVIDQKVSHTKQQITWALSSIIDRFGLRLPRRQVLRDGDSRNPGFPGVSRYRGQRS
jgi:lambda family phage minor tail protein L